MYSQVQDREEMYDDFRGDQNPELQERLQNGMQDRTR